MLGNKIGFFSPAPPVATATVDTDLFLIRTPDRDYKSSQRVLERGWVPSYTVREGKTEFELQENKPGEAEPANKLTGRFQYVVYRDDKANNQITMDIGTGAHYLIGRGRGRAIIAGDIDFHEGRLVGIQDASGTYHYPLEGCAQEKREKIYAAQEAALRTLRIPEKLISSLQRFVPLKEAIGEGCSRNERTGQ